MSESFNIRALTAMPDLNATVDLQKAVWGMQDFEVSSPHTLKAIVHSGGAVFGALAHEKGEAAGRLVGFCFGFAAPREGELWLWSHMAAVHPDYQGRGIGYRLKQAQRAWALENGYRWMAWTFDPMQTGNANFNFNRLGVTARRYSVNHYGEMHDGLNAGLASDRLEAQWQLDAPPPAPRSQNEVERGLKPGGISMLLYADSEGRLCQRRPSAYDRAQYSIEAPTNIAELKRHDIERAKRWQLHLREAMTDLLANGYIVSGFERAGDRGFYIMSQPLPPAPSRRSMST